MRKGLLLSFVLSAALITLFQNCGRVQFGEQEKLVAKADAPSASDETPLPSTPGPNDETPIPTESGDGGPMTPPPTDTTAQESAHHYVCVLAGPGKSVKLALESDRLIEKNGTPQDICMSQDACLKIASQKFSVKGPEKRGFCPNKNPHVIELSNAQLKKLIEAMP